MSQSFIYRGRGETDVLFTASDSNGCVYRGYGMGGDQVALFDGNEVFEGMNKASSPLAVLDGSTVRCPYSNVKIGEIRGKSFYDGFAGGTPLLTLHGDSVMALVAAAALTIEDKNIYDGEENGRPYSTANDSSVEYHRELNKRTSYMSSSDGVSEDDDCYGGSSARSSTVVSGPLVDSVPDDVCGHGGGSSASRSERFMTDEDGRRISLNMPVSSGSVVTRSYEERFRQEFMSVDKSIRSMWADSDIDNFKKLIVSGSSSPADGTISRYIRERSNLLSNGVLSEIAVCEDKMNGVGTEEHRSVLYILIACTLFSFAALISGRVSVFGGLLITVAFGAAAVINYRLVRDRSCLIRAIYANVIYPADSVAEIVSAVILFLAAIHSPIQIVSLCLHVTAGLFLAKFVVGIVRGRRPVRTKLYRHFESRRNGLLDGSDVRIRQMKDNLDRLENIIGKEKYLRLAKLGI